MLDERVDPYGVTPVATVRAGRSTPSTLRQVLLAAAGGLDAIAAHRFWRRAAVAGMELALALVAVLGALALVNSSPLIPVGTFAAAVTILVGSKLAVGLLAGTLGGRWRYVGVHDAALLARGTVISAAAAFAALQLLEVAQPALRLTVADGAGYLILACGVRLGVRRLHEWGRRAGAGIPRRALIVGAGEAGSALVKSLLASPKMLLDPVALLDDDPNKQGTRLHGVPIAGSVDRLSAIAEEYEPDEIVVAIPSGTPEQIGRIVDACVTTKLPVRVAPDPEDLFGRRSDSRIRDMQPSDLLGRPQADLNIGELRAELGRARVLITGAAGSIGSELVRQLTKIRPAVLYLLDRNENDLYFLCEELQRREVTVPSVEVIQDIRDERRLLRVFREARPTHVFHAAAFKHVPLMEFHALEAVENNVLGTWSVLQAALAAGARKFVLISTDKAVRPTNVMGATKRFAEVLVAETTRGTPMDGVIVRFGNVLGSAGSVVPLFERQIRAGGPLTVTSREATRYFMTPSEAAQLVLQAASIPDSAGKVSILDMGTPVRIWDLAERMIRMSGLRPGADIDMVETGLRPGEKLHEELWWDVEDSEASSHPKITLADVGRLREPAIPLIKAFRQLIDREDEATLLDLLGGSVGLTNDTGSPARASHDRRSNAVPA